MGEIISTIFILETVNCIAEVKTIPCANLDVATPVLVAINQLVNQSLVLRYLPIIKPEEMNVHSFLVHYLSLFRGTGIR